MTTKLKSTVAQAPFAEFDDDWSDGADRSDNPAVTGKRQWFSGLHDWLMLDDSGGDSRRWRLSTYRIIIASSLLLCLTIAVHSFATAWSLGLASVIATVCAYYVALILSLHIGKKSPGIGATLLLSMVYICGLLILFGVGDRALSDLGVIFLYVAPVIAWIYFGRTKAFVLMVANTLPFLFMVSPGRPLTPLGFDMLMPNSHLYMHALLFLFFNISIPLALFRVVSALNHCAASNQQIAQRLKQNSLLYRDMFEHAGGPTLICNRGGGILRANNKVCALLGREALAIESTLELAELFEPIAPATTVNTLLRVATNTGFAEGEFLARTSAHDKVEVLLSLKSLSQRCLLVVVRDLSTLRTMERELAQATAARDRLIAFDPLTNLPNRESLQVQLQRLMGEATPYQRSALLAVACLRLNSIRSVNEKFGQPQGDDLIQAFGVLLAQQQRQNLQVFRLRGVVFLIAITGCSTPEQIRSVLEGFLGQLPNQHTLGDQVIELDISVGAAFTRGKEISVDELIHRSERALEIARKQAKEPLVLFNEESAREIHREIDISLALPHAIARNELSILYQPKVDAERKICGLEALLRWHSVELGIVSPAEFIPIAERVGKVAVISNFVIETVCRQQALWHQRFGTIWPVAINLSGIDLQRDDLATHIQQVLLRHRVDPGWLQIEITETGLIENDLVARRNIDRLIAIGLKVAIDDIGTGYSSLKKLSEYPIHIIKVDRSFVSAIGKNRRSERIIQLVLTLAKVLGCEVVAEGVETRRQLQFLQENGCNHFQGYLFYKPLSHTDIDTLIGATR